VHDKAPLQIHIYRIWIANEVIKDPDLDFVKDFPKHSAWKRWTEEFSLDE